MSTTDLKAALAAHLEFQRGCYIDTCEQHPDGTLYIASDCANDLVWNRAVAKSSDLAETPIEWIKQRAAAHGRKAAIASFIEERDDGHPTWGDTPIPERWMFATGETFVGRVSTGFDIRGTSQPIPSPAFLELFGNLYEDATVNQFFVENYVAALSKARSTGPEVRHLVLFAEGEAVSCASLYFSGEWAGLYNVGTHWRHQRKGYGAAISAEAVAIALENGVQKVQLQCAANTHVEVMYKNIGFKERRTATVIPIL